MVFALPDILYTFMINNTVHTTSQPVEYMSKKKHILSIFIT